jgi:hypothetical protein
MGQSAKVIGAASVFQHSALNASIGLSLNSDHGALLSIGNLSPGQLEAFAFLRGCEATAATLICMVENALCGLVPKWWNLAAIISSILAIAMHDSGAKSTERAKAVQTALSMIIPADESNATSTREPFNTTKSLGAAIAKCVASLYDPSAPTTLADIAASAAREHLAAAVTAASTEMDIWRELAPFALLKLELVGETAPGIARTSAPAQGGGSAAADFTLPFLELPKDASTPWVFAEMLPVLTSYLGLAAAAAVTLNSGSASCSSSEPLLSMPDWKSKVLSSVLHLPARYDQLVVKLSDANMLCSICNERPSKPAVCLTCGSVVCVQKTRQPELFEHSRRCGKGIGMFVLVKATTMLVLDAVNVRAMQPSSIYVDRYGERDEGLARGVSLSLSPRLSEEFLQLFVASAWDTDTALLRNAWKHAVDQL